MKTINDIKDDVYGILRNSNPMRKVTGKLFKRKRPLKSNKEDVVISVISSGTGERQEAFVNVNVYVKQIDIEGQFDEDSERLSFLSKTFGEYLNSLQGKDFWLTLETQNVLEIEATHENVLNFKLSYKTINL